MNKPFDNRPQTTSPSVFQGAVLDSQGNEVPITEAMIQHACQRLQASLEETISPIQSRQQTEH